MYPTFQLKLMKCLSQCSKIILLLTKNEQTIVLLPRKNTNTWDNVKVDSPMYMKQFWLSKLWKLTKILELIVANNEHIHTSNRLCCAKVPNMHRN